MKEVQVKVPGHSYTIKLGSGVIKELPAELKRLNPSSCLIATNITVGSLYLKKATDLCNGMCRTESVVLPDGEAYKDWGSVSAILEKLASMGADRKSVVIALGGGVVGDLAGFAAAIYMRGIRFIQVPTTLLAMVDSSVGGKTGMNMTAGKNLVGTFHQPEAVIADSDFLRTLPEREIGAGIAEIIKHGVLADKTYFEELERDMEKLRALDPETVAEVVGRSCEIKAGVVSRDEKEKGERAKLNLGHTFGHAIEKLTGYGTWLHGEAVAVGTVLAAVTAEKQDKINCGDVKRIQDLIHRAGLPVRIAGISASKAIEAMKGDKKSTKGVPHFILPVAIGTTVIEEVPEGLIKEALLEEGYEP